MKFIIPILVYVSFVSLGQSPDATNKAAIIRLRLYCESTTLANPHLIFKVRRGDFTVDDEKVKKYSFCVYKTLGMATSEGLGDKEAGLKLISSPTDPAKFGAAFDACNNQTGDSPEEKIWKFLVCYSKEYPGDISAL